MNEERLRELASRIRNETARANWLKFMSGVELDQPQEEYEDDSDGVTPIQVAELKAADRQRLAHIEQSIDNPFDDDEQVEVPTGINAREHNGLTALHSAVMDGDLPRVRELLAQGADKTLKDTSGFTPADIAARLGELDILPLLK